MSNITFSDRRDGGRKLALKLKRYSDNSVVLALPRGGVETAIEVAVELDSPLSLCVARKIGHPSNPEYAIGSVTANGPAVWNTAEKEELGTSWSGQAENKARKEAKRREAEYLSGRAKPALKDKTVILVDDGMATGYTMQAAISEVSKQRPGQIIVAVPVASSDAVDLVMDMAYEVVTVARTEEFLGAVGSHYDTFPQLSDKDVTNLLDEADERI